MTLFSDCCENPCGSVSLRSSALTRAATGATVYALLSSWTNASTIAGDDLQEFTHMGSGKLRYDGAEARAFLCIACVSIAYDAATGGVSLKLFFGANETSDISHATLTAAASYQNISFHKVKILNPGDTVEIGINSPQGASTINGVQLCIR